jgi:hypothetical protein
MVLSLYRWSIAAVSLLFFYQGRTDSLLVNHPFYMTVTEINHNAKEKIIEISCKIFTDDLQTALKKSSGNKIMLSGQNNKAATDKLVAAYIMKHLQLKIDDRPVTLQFVGSEKEDEAVWSYFRVNDISTIKKIDIINDLLYECFDSEINLMHVMANGNRQSKKINNPDVHVVFEFAVP